MINLDLTFIFVSMEVEYSCVKYIFYISTLFLKLNGK